MSPLTQPAAHDNTPDLQQQQEMIKQTGQVEQQGTDNPTLSTVAIAVICVCCVVGVTLLIGFIFILRRIQRKQNAKTAGFVSFRDVQETPWHNNNNNNKSSTCTERLPPPETHDLVFNSILEHAPRAPPPTTLSSTHHHFRQHTNNSTSNNTTTTSSMSTMMMFEDGYEKMGNEDDKILMSLARQGEWKDLYRPSTPQLEQQHQQHNHQRISTGSSYHVW
ncbi:hypothetical protein BDA99DRAFT_517657 [Phascolomyces articulosus]|uniref:Uncharacterized protein n=1 Tax=Phascolomyces articulosus TaxID=60185 RepID=A0AAD5PBD2_9FUNG|nr:hypothetical protein BDA99DRAFT_517657 [Phascolomyces articulosus]